MYVPCRMWQINCHAMLCAKSKRKRHVASVAREANFWRFPLASGYPAYNYILVEMRSKVRKLFMLTNVCACVCECHTHVQRDRKCQRNAKFLESCLKVMQNASSKFVVIFVFLYLMCFVQFFLCCKYGQNPVMSACHTLPRRIHTHTHTRIHTHTCIENSLRLLFCMLNEIVAD